MNVRAVAAKIIYQVVVKQRSLTDAIAFSSLTDERDQALIQAISFGVCRRYFYLDALAHSLLKKPLKDKDQDIYFLLLVGLFQLANMRIPAHAAVSETVAAADAFKKPWAKSLINGVLRHYQREAAELKLNLSKAAYYEHPEWMLVKLKSDWPDDWQAILRANNEHPPFSLRVNQSRGSREDYLSRLAANDIKAYIIPETLSGITLEQAVNVAEVPGFAQGEVSVQDGAAQMAAKLMDLAPGQKVLDACAAPGGKAAHILELQPDIELVAVDKDAERLTSVIENLQRLQLSAKVICVDVINKAEWWGGQLFDRILLDAPCSATGVIRRHPDIKLLRREDDVAKLLPLQEKLLQTLWELVRPGGLLIYATCSIFKAENSDLLASFLQEHSDAVEEVIQENIGKACRVGRQILPGMSGMDGFYYGRLRKLLRN